MKILTVDDHELFRTGLREVLRGLKPRPALVEAGTAEEALAAAAAHDDLDLVLLDLGLPDVDGFTLLKKLRARHPLVSVVVVSGQESPRQIKAALDGGAAGFVPKSSRKDVILGALELVRAGGTYVPPGVLDLAAIEAEERTAQAKAEARRARTAGLTPRQREVLELMAKGLTNKEIAGVLGIAPLTVKVHVAAVLQALDVSNRTEAVMAMVELGLVATPEH